MMAHYGDTPTVAENPGKPNLVRLKSKSDSILYTLKVLNFAGTLNFAGI